MNQELDGYVIYPSNSLESLPLGVVNDNYECLATSDRFNIYLKEFLVVIEDRRFYNHFGIDYIGVTRALFQNIKQLRISQGGSSITQQLARNLLKDNSKTVTRKVKESIKALQLEYTYSKDEILNQYLNNVYFGKNLRGIRAASLYYFSKELPNLSQSEVLVLLTLLRGPNYYANNLLQLRKRYLLLNNILYKNKFISQNRYKKNKNYKINLQQNKLQVLDKTIIPFIKKEIKENERVIISSIEDRLQKSITQSIKESNYPVTIIIVKKGQVVAFGSTYGPKYPFLSRSNVGSTLKPFIYCYLRERGITSDQRFSSRDNDFNWPVREVTNIQDSINIQEALLYSNNNAFINASNKVNINLVLLYLSSVLNIDISNLYPSSILGATKNGISVYELALTYNIFFNAENLNEFKIECLSILNRNIYEKLNISLKNSFLKTGTTNNNKERYCVIGHEEITCVILRNENPIDDISKEGNFLIQAKNIFNNLMNNISKPKDSYKWM